MNFLKNSFKKYFQISENFERNKKQIIKVRY